MTTYINDSRGVGYGGADEQGQRIGPGQQAILFPPALDHQIHIEAQHKRHGYVLALLGKVLANLVEDSDIQKYKYTYICIYQIFVSYL